ncbi:MAG: hypothetical protein KJO31_13755 [Gammaproteobacteria bacterium]|nr:hypothetical protein [Gammaproteobacteria bacterium]
MTVIESVVNWIEGGVINSWVVGSAWVWPTLEILHFVGLSLLLGAIVVVDLRMAGLIRSLELTAVTRLLPLAGLGFLINVTTGVLFFFGDPARYSVNVGFQIKMLLVVLAGVNALWFFMKIEPQVQHWTPGSAPPLTARLVGVTSLATWFGVLLLGRLIPYIGTG